MTTPDAIRWSDPPKSRQAEAGRAGMLEPQEVGKFGEGKVRLKQSGGGEGTLARFSRRTVATNDMESG